MKNANFFKLISSADLPRKLVCLYQKRVLKSIEEIARATLTLKNNTDTYEKIVSKLTELNAFHLSSDIYALNYYLVQYLKIEKNLTKVLELLNLFSNANDLPPK